jgi:hypothetical protein
MRRSHAWLSILAWGLLAPVSFAQGIVTQWNFPTGFSTSSPVPSTGSGTASLVGGTTATSAGGLTNGGSTEAVTGSVAWNTTTYAAVTTGSGTRGVGFAVNTTGQSNLVFRYDVRNSNTSSKFYRVEYTTDGTTYTPFATTNAVLGGDAWTNNRTFDLSGISAANNNANFGLRIVAIFDPSGSDYTGTGAAYATGGTVRYDAVTLSSGFVWAGGSGTSLDTAANYSGGTAPTSTGTLLLNATAGTNTAISVDAPRSLDQIVYNASAPATTISGSSILTLNAGILNNATAVQTITAPVNFGTSNGLHTAAGSTLVMGGAVQYANFIKILGEGRVEFNSTVTSVAPAATTSGNPTLPTIQVTPGTSLGGTGTIGSASLNTIQVFFGTLQPGSLTTAGTLTLNGTYSTGAGSTYVAKIASAGTADPALPGGSSDSLTAPTNHNYLNIATGTGATVANLAAQNYTVDGTGVTFVDGATYSYKIMQDSAVDTSSLNLATQSQFTAVGFSATNFSLTGDGTGGVYLAFAVIPEPGTLLGLGAAGMGLVGLFRRRRLAA